jgi:glycosyltransferase involved in cell wall biosynthesis
LDVFDAWRPKLDKPRQETVLGWIGGKDTADALYVIYEPLERLFARYDSLHLRILGAPRERLPRFEKVRFSILERYDQETMVREALGMHIGLFPQFEVEESVNRGSLKAKIYMCGEAAAVCQDLGENRDLVEDGVNGMLAASGEEWLGKLDWLISHPEERARIAAAGLATIRERFATAKCYERLRTALSALDERTDEDFGNS